MLGRSPYSLFTSGGTLLCCLAVLGRTGAHELRLTNAEGVAPSVSLILESDAEVQGLIAVFDWNGDLFHGADLVNGPPLTVADLVVRRVENAYLVLGVVMDTDGRGPSFIPPGTSTVATARFVCVASPADVPRSTDLVFRDGLYGSVDLGPDLTNLLTVGGQTISAGEGLALRSGRIICPAVVPGSLRLRNATASSGSGCAPVDVILDTPSRVQGFTLAIAHDPAALDLTGITIAGTVSESSGADFSMSAVLPEGGTLGVILDLEPPFLGNTLPIGNGLVIAKYSYCCRNRPPPGGAPSVSTLRFVDGALGEPPLENVLVVEGRSLEPRELVPGTFTCLPAEEPTGQEFHCGPGRDGPAGGLGPIVGLAGSTVRISFYYRSPPKETPGDTGEDQIQGLSMALCFDPRWLQCQEGTFGIGGTITEAVGAEFVNHHCENDPNDGDPGELIVGILVDALPPFDGHTLPPTADLLKIGGIDFRIAADAPCNRCFPIEFCNGADGRGEVAVRNLISVNNFSTEPSFFNCEVCVAPTPVFQRGDCNFSGGPLGVDLADAAAVISFLFLTDAWQFLPPCLDACDANDDGRVDFADSISVLRYLFQHGSVPPPPGPVDPGPDPTPDKLSCARGAACE